MQDQYMLEHTAVCLLRFSTCCVFPFQFYNDYGDIIKATLGKAREINKVMTAKTLAMSLTGLFSEVQQEQGWNVDRGSEPFQSIKVYDGNADGDVERPGIRYCIGD